LKRRFKTPELRVLQGNTARWFRERIDPGPVLSLMAGKTVPVHRHSWIYLLGGAATFLLGLQVVSGALLMLYYQPSDTTAHESVQRIMTEVPLGRVVRSVHAWGSHFFIAVVAVHFLVKLFTGAYRKPREITWICGVLLLFVALAFGFSGYLLPWNELSYYATSVGTSIPGAVMGDWIVHFLLGGRYVTGDTLTRFFAAHVIFLPLVCGLLLAVHLGLIQAQGMSLPLKMAKDGVRDAMPFFSEFLLIELCVWLLIFGTIVTLATLLPAEIGVKADALADTPEGVRPEWYFLFMSQTLKFVPKTAAVLFYSLVALFLLVVPFVDRKAMREERSPWLTALFVLLVVYAAAFEIWAVATPGVEQATTQPVSGDVDVAGNAVSLAMFWVVIGFLVFYLRQLRMENNRIRRLYGPSQ